MLSERGGEVVTFDSIQDVGEGEGPLPGEVLFAVQYLVRWREKSGGTLKPLRRQRVESLEDGSEVCRQWEAGWPASDLSSAAVKKRRRVEGQQGEVVQRRGTVIGVVGCQGDQGEADRLVWTGVLESEQRNWPFRLRIVWS
jgi:hypothetical protein